jgi:hypothetical protein
MTTYGGNMQLTSSKGMLIRIKCIGCVWLNFVYLSLFKNTQWGRIA